MTQRFLGTLVLGTLAVLLAVATGALAQAPPPTVVAPPPTAFRPMPAKRTPPARRPVPRPAPKAAPKAAARPAAPSGSWIRLNAHLLGGVGESTWVNLSQAANIRFYQTGKTAFAAVGTGGSSYVSTSDPAEVQKLKAYVLAHQTH